MSTASARIINESTSLVLASQDQSLIYVSTTATPGQLVTVVDANGIAGPTQPIILSTIGGANFIGDATSLPLTNLLEIRQRFGYVTLHSELLGGTTGTASNWTVVNLNSFAEPDTPANIKGLNTHELAIQGDLLSRNLISSSQVVARAGTALSSLEGRGLGALTTSSLYVANLGAYISSSALDPRLVIDDSALIYDSTFINGRLQIRGSLSSGSALFAATNISSKLGAISITGDLQTMSSIRNQRAVQTVAGFASTFGPASFGANANYFSSFALAGQLQAGALSTSRIQTNTISVASSIQFGSAFPATTYWQTTANAIVFQNLPATIPSISTNNVVNTQSIFTPRIFLSSLSTATTVQTIRLSSAQIRNPNGSLATSSLAANTVLTLQALLSRETAASARFIAHRIRMNDGAAGGGPPAPPFAIPVPPNDPQPFGLFVGQANWIISSPTGALSTPQHGLSTQSLGATFIATSTLRAVSNTYTNFSATDLGLTRTLTVGSTFSALNTPIQNSGGRILNTTSVVAQNARTSTVSTQSIVATGTPASTIRLAPLSTTTATAATISSLAANLLITSSLTLTQASLGAPFSYSTITPPSSWLLPSTFGLGKPPFQYTEGQGTFFDKVFFTAAQDCVAYYSIIDPRSQTPATLSTLHVNTVAGTGTAGVTGRSIGDVYGAPVMDSTFATYFGDNLGIWRLRRLASDGTISTMGGRTRFFYGDDGPALSAGLGPKIFVALDSTDSVLVTDVSNVRIRRAFFDGTFNTIAGNGIEGYTGDGGLAVSATLRGPATTAADSAGTVYIADSDNNVIRAIINSTITTYAGTGTAGSSGDGGPATTATFSAPFGLAVNPADNALFIADTGNHVVRRVDPISGIVTRVAGTSGSPGFSGDGGPATTAQLSSPKGVAVDTSGNLFIVDSGNVRLRRVDTSSGIITTVTGTGVNGYGGDNGPAGAATLNNPVGVTTDLSNNVYIADTGNHIVRQIIASTGLIYRFAGIAGTAGFGGDGSFATFARLNTPTTVAYDPVSKKLYVADEGNFRVRIIDVPTNIINTVIGNGSPAAGGDGGPIAEAIFGSIFALARDSAQNLYVADGYGQKIRRIDPSTFNITTIAGTGAAGYSGDGGPAIAANLSTPVGLFIDGANNIFFTDSENHRVRRIDAATGVITTVAGTGTIGYNGDSIPATTAQLSFPRALAADTAGNLFIGDTSNYRIRRVAAATNIITTVAGTGFAGTVSPGLPAVVTSLGTVTGIAVDRSTNLYFADLGTSALWRVPASSGIVEAFSATGPGYLNDAAPLSSAIFRYPSALSFDACGNFVVADRGNYRLRRSYSYGPPRLPNYLNLDFRFTNYQNPNGNSYIALNGNVLAMFDAASLLDYTFQVTDSNILSFPLQSSNPVLGDQTPWLEIGQANSTDYIQLDGLAWVNQTLAQGTLSNSVNSDAGIIMNRGILRFPNRVNAITIDNKFNDASTRSVFYTGSLFASSDPLLKEKIEPVDAGLCVSSLLALPLKRYAYKAGSLPVQDRHRLGYLTTEIASVFPKSIRKNTTDGLDPAVLPISSFDTVDFTQLKYSHLGTTQALLKEVQRLETLVAALRQRRRAQGALKEPLSLDRSGS